MSSFETVLLYGGQENQLQIWQLVVAVGVFGLCSFFVLWTYRASSGSKSSLTPAFASRMVVLGALGVMLMVALESEGNRLLALALLLGLTSIHRLCETKREVIVLCYFLIIAFCCASRLYGIAILGTLSVNTLWLLGCRLFASRSS